MTELNDRIKKLPPFIGEEIFSFIIQDSKQINFSKEPNSIFCAGFSNKYQTAFLNEKRIKNSNGEFLSRIKNNNGKHRYYITTKEEHETCDNCGERCYSYRFCEGTLSYSLTYTSTYIGKNLDYALLHFIN